MREKCLVEITGSCRGCNILVLAQRRFRWKKISLEQAARDISKIYCPKGLSPDISLMRNNEASLSFGQRKEENIDFTNT